MELQQDYIDEGDDHILTWKGMKQLLRRIFAPSTERHAYHKTKASTSCVPIHQVTKQNQCSSWSDSITREERLNIHKQQDATNKHYAEKKEVNAAIPKLKVSASVQHASFNRCRKVAGTAQDFLGPALQLCERNPSMDPSLYMCYTCYQVGAGTCATIVDEFSTINAASERLVRAIKDASSNTVYFAVERPRS